MMNFPLLVLASLTAAALFARGDGEPAVTYINHEKVGGALAAGGTLIKASDLIVMGAHRSGGGQVELHEKETDVFYVVDGDATFITGGKMVGGNVTSPGQWRATEIEGGEVHHLTKGDVMVIPAGIPHWFKDVPHSVSYFVVKVLKQ
ncbi:MAG: cupin domain-containing protein [Terriglobia bacterium]|jgi:mannose-6-phosphate isomerase-like protein (cupin superfamily)